MSDVVIRAQGLGKKYLIGHQSNERYTALRDVLGRMARDFVRSARDMMQGRQLVEGEEVEEFWALKDVSFEIRRGDVVGVIGRNGAGKSTLLKVLSRITEPSAGRVEIRGRVASLLEVGTGFHPELSGRENIYLNGAILGMSRAEIKRKFDEIVAFAEVEQFLDTPVKRYSSGMYVRLAFAVAAHLEPEILIVDEVLAVGDAEFQKKCLGKMSEVAGRGRTVLFVSHNMSAIRELCKTSMLLTSGSLGFSGASGDVIHRYASSSVKRASGSGNEIFEAIDLRHGETSHRFVTLNLNLRNTNYGPFEFRAFVSGAIGDPVGVISIGGFNSRGIVPGSGNTKLSVDISHLAQGVYYIDAELVRLSDHKVFRAPERIEFVHDPAPLPGELSVFRSEWGHGFVRFPTSIQDRAGS